MGEAPLRILLTIQTLKGRPGGSLYVADLARELLRRGHRPMVYSPENGALGDELRSLTVPVVERLERVSVAPDLIHGNSPVETAAAVFRFPGSPAIYVCHGWDSPDARPPRLRQIMRYIAVDEACEDRLLCHEGIPPELVEVRFNAVDLDRFRPRNPLPSRPRRALVFSHYATEQDAVPVLREACRRAGIALEVAGEGTHSATAAPQYLLGRFDLVFAKARCALEALATGTAVIVCDAGGLAEMVTPENWRGLRRMNFGRRSLQRPVRVELVEQEIARYDAREAARVCAEVRASQGLAGAVEGFLGVYQEAINSFRTLPQPDAATDLAAAAVFVESIARYSHSFHLAAERQAAEAKLAEAREMVQAVDALAPMLPLKPSERLRIRISHVEAPPRVRHGDAFPAALEVHNDSDRYLASHAPHPVHIAYHWLSGGRAEVFEGVRTRLVPPLPGGGARSYLASVEAPANPGSWVLRVTLVQENVAWLDTAGASAFADVPVEVI